MVAGGRFSDGDGAHPVGSRRKEFWMNVLRGAIATFVIGLVPLVKIIAPAGGGALARYVQNTGARDGAKVGVLAWAIGGVILNALAPPRFFGLVSGDIGDEIFAIAVLLGFVVWVVTSAFGALGARLAEDRYG